MYKFKMPRKLKSIEEPRIDQNDNQSTPPSPPKAIPSASISKDKIKSTSSIPSIPPTPTTINPTFDNELDNATIIQALKNNKDVRDVTSNGYATRLNILTTVLNADLFNIMMNPNKFYTKIVQKYDNVGTRKNFVTAILASFKCLKKQRLIIMNDEQNKALDEWQLMHKDLKSLETEKNSQNEPTQKQSDQYISFDRINTKYNELKKKHMSIQHKSLSDSMYFLFLSVLVHTPPKRCDYANMKIYYNHDPDAINENYLVLYDPKNESKTNTNLSPTPSYFAFYRYKTSDKYSKVVQELPEPLLEDIKNSLRKFDRSYLFVNKYNKPYADNGAISKFVIRMFESLFGKHTGTTMVRHIFISEKIDNNRLSEAEKEEIARLMMHSTDLQATYRWRQIQKS